jgi:hypothetical protein
MLAITISATKSYLYAWPQCIRALAAAGSHHDEAHVIFSTDESKESKDAEDVLRRELPDGWKITTIRMKMDEDAKDYKQTAQLRIAALQGAGFSLARKIRSTSCLVLESDVIMPPNALRVLEWTLSMPSEDGSPYYDVSAATYQNGLFLGGFGTPQNPIAEDFLAKERKIYPRLKSAWDTCEDRLKKEPSEKEGKRLARLKEKIKKLPADGNIWEVTSKHGWRRRGWLDFAYPGIGKGSIVPIDWCGLGCTLLSQKALALANFTGYDGGGTQDLFLCWHRWHPAGIQIACAPHVACDHIKRDGDKIIHHRAFHEQEGEYRGHLRSRSQPFIPA